jgi:tetratricopeptide (TPR) repeat protein
MADHRKYFRPRRLAFGGRLFPRGCIFGAALALLSAFSPALAEDAGLKSGAASLAAGKYDNAVRQLSATVNSENASPGEAAKALYLRGIAYRKLGQPARAIADLGAAIWLGLPDEDRVKALVNRGLAFQAAGLSSQGEAEIAQARKVGGNGAVDQLIAEGGGSAGTTADITAFATEVRAEDQGGSSAAAARAEPLPGFNTSVSGGEAPPPPSTRTADASPKSAGDAPSSWSTSVNGDSTPPSSGNRLTRWFGSLTDSSESSSAGASSEPTPALSAPRAAPAPAPAAAPAPVNSSWTTKTETQEAPSGSEGGGQSKGWGRWFSKTAEPEAPAEPAAAPSSAGGGGYRLQLATSQSEEEAQALYKKVASQNPELASKQPEIEKVDIGNFGTFYSLKIGPFPDKAESLKLCNALKRSGVDCLLATP